MERAAATMPATSPAWRRPALARPSDRALSLPIRALLIAAALAQFACRPRQDLLTFQVRVSDLRRPANRLANGKSPDDLVEITLAGQLRRPPIPLAPISRRDADWSTPEGAAASVVSASL